MQRQNRCAARERFAFWLETVYNEGDRDQGDQGGLHQFDTFGARPTTLTTYVKFCVFKRY